MKELTLTLAVDGEVCPIDKTALLNRLFKIYSDSNGTGFPDSQRYNNVKA